MKYFLIILLAISPLTDLDKIAKINDIKKEAKAAYKNGNYKKAIKQYNYLLDSMKVEDESITLNLANAYYQLKDSTSLSSAEQNYQSLTNSNDNEIKSVAHLQLGVMANRAKKFEEALAHFKDAIRANPENDDARYNYEMLKKMLEEQKKKDQEKKKDQNQQNKDQNKQDQDKKDQQNKKGDNKDQQKQDQQQNEQKNKDGDKKDQKDQQNKENKEGDKKDDQQKQDQQQKEDGKEGEEEKDQQPKPEDGEKSDKKGDQEQMQSISDKLKEMKISEEKAKMIMEALKNNEIQYIQQNKKKATKRTDPNKPDW